MSAAQMLSSNKNKRSPATLSGSPRKEGGLGTAKQLGGKCWLLPFLKNPAGYRAYLAGKKLLLSILQAFTFGCCINLSFWCMSCADKSSSFHPGVKFLRAYSACCDGTNPNTMQCPSHLLKDEISLVECWKNFEQICRPRAVLQVSAACRSKATWEFEGKFVLVHRALCHQGVFEMSMRNVVFLCDRYATRRDFAGYNERPFEQEISGTPYKLVLSKYTYFQWSVCLPT